MPDLASLRPGDPERVREYRLTGRLGEGGQGTVFLGVSPTGARAAVKLLRADLAQDEEALERFVREVSTTQRVAPFCTAAVIDTGVNQHRPYIISEYIDGPTLDAVVATEGPREGSALHRLAIGTVTALVAIHQAGIVHRDFKPSNVLLAPDGPRVIDFGIAKALDRTSTLTATAIGTPSYMTPEQLAGENSGSSADMFAWGCTMVFAATGRPPFGTDSLPAIFNRIINLEPDLRAITDPALRELVGQCLAKDAALRPAAGEALLRLLGHASGAPSPTAPRGILAEGSAAAAQPAGSDVHSPSRQAGPGHPQQGPGYRQAVSQLHGGPLAHPSPLPSPYPAEGAAKRGRGVQLSIGAGLAVTLVTAAGIALASRGTKPDRVVSAQATGTQQAATSQPGGPTPTPTVSALPQATRTIKLPGSSITLHESDDDPIKLSSYDTARGENLYVRTPGTGDFIKNNEYIHYTVNASGTQALATDRFYDGDHYSVVSVVDRRPGSAKKIKIKIAKTPVYSFEPQWSPDGTRGLTTLYEVGGGTSKKQAYTFKKYGYAVIDIAGKKADIVRVKKRDDSVGGYFWRRDGQAVGAWVLTDKTPHIRFYDLRGTVLQTLPDIGIPLSGGGESISPSGTLLVTYCRGTTEEACVWSTDADAEAQIRVPFETGRFIGWYDDRHIAGWRRKGGGYEAVVIDFQGQVKRVLAVVADAKEYEKQPMRFSRGR
ncbi:serine/threonine protein kinase [Streptosporangium album]|uniref:non-specific serine/threonine protein kinase n=1 Tax=Streptosporangium album TaxID=47479 RepID=A0A7W7RUI3_9ACTN|nr:serine/threonine-protein kinase [Streptosporangium album]MBB4938448.1 serine/threonine protein kinase [Streptosporangium album]